MIETGLYAESEKNTKPVLNSTIHTSASEPDTSTAQPVQEIDIKLHRESRPGYMT